MKRLQRVVLWVWAVACVAFATSASAGLIDGGAPGGDTWMAWGGQTSLMLKTGELKQLGVELVGAEGTVDATVRHGRDFIPYTFPILETGSVKFRAPGGVLDTMLGGSLQHSGGLRFTAGGHAIDLRGFSIRPRAGTAMGFEIVDTSGRDWFWLDHGHYHLQKDSATLKFDNVNVRLSSRFADAIGSADLAGFTVGIAQFEANVFVRGADAPTACSADWPGVNGAQADVLLVNRGDTVQQVDCAGCGVGTFTGTVTVAPDSSLKSVGTADVAWYTKLSGTFPPYGNDQHPFLIWNLYRVDANGRIKQIGKSGVKHAFLTVNVACGCNAGHVLHPQCEDTYGVGNNDSDNDLGPRSEIIPAPAIWGRCGSIFDANCDGSQDSNGSPSPTNRLNTAESDLAASLNVGAHYFFEYWYIVRDDVNIYNTMGYKSVTPTKSSTHWSFAPGTLVNGPYLNAWVDPAGTSTTETNKELSTPLGHARVAVKATDLGNGTWRYEYAVQNFDYAHADIDPAHATEPNIKVLSNHGFDRFLVNFAAGTTITDVRFDDVDLDAGNDWAPTVGANTIAWDAPNAASALDWGTMYHFEFTANAAPAVSGIEARGIATSSEGAITYLLDVIGPQGANDVIFANGFETPGITSGARP